MEVWFENPAVGASEWELSQTQRSAAAASIQHACRAVGSLGWSVHRAPVQGHSDLEPGPTTCDSTHTSRRRIRSDRETDPRTHHRSECEPAKRQWDYQCSRPCCPESRA